MICFQGAAGKAGKPGPSGDPVRLFNTILYLFSCIELTIPLQQKRYFAYLNHFLLCIQGLKAERGDKGGPGEKGEQVSLF